MRRPREFIAPVLIAFAPLLYFLPATLGQIVLADGDAAIFGMPLRIATAEMIRDGHLPLWNPYIFCGMPLFASAQAGTLFPLNWGFLILPANVAMNLSVLGSYAAAGVGMYFYARRSGASLLGAGISALVWQFGGVNLGQIAHTNMLHVCAVLPWIFWSIDGYVLQPTRRRAALISLIVALAVFTGYFQTLAYALLLAGAYALVHGTAENETRRRPWLLAIVFLGIGVLLGAVQILPSLELVPHSLHADGSYEYFSSYSLPPVFLLSWFAPYIVGGGDGTLFRAPYTGEPFYAEFAGYVAIAPLILAAIAPFFRRDRRTRFWMWTALICLLLALGRFLPFEIYRLAYHVPFLNLFRVPARHLMEVDFALAVLAGRAVTFFPEVRRARRLAVTAFITIVVLCLTWSAVTWWRPAIFKLGRAAPISVLRAPELFMPLVLAIASGWAIWRFAQARRFAGALLIAVIACDLALWGQFSGWRAGSLRPADDRFRTPQFVKEMREQIARDGPLRILSIDRPLADALAQAPATPGIDINLQPDVYMVHRIENAAGYDGFGFKRYAELAGDMKIWGELPDAKRSLVVSRELDLLNVRYLVAAPGHAGSAVPPLPARVKLGDFFFSEGDLGLPFLEDAMRVDFGAPSVEATRVAVVTSLAWSADLPDGTVVGRITLRANDGRKLSFDLRAGLDTSEWAHDRPDAVMRHSRAPVAISGKAEAAGVTFDSHSYVASFALAERVTIAAGTIEVAHVAEAPRLALGIQRISLIDETQNRTVPIRAEWITGVQDRLMQTVTERWPERKRAENVVIYENPRALPRTWLTSQARAVSDKQALEVIRTTKFSDGSEWDALRTVLVEKPLNLSSDSEMAEQEARIIRHEPNEVEIVARARSRAILVLADNHYPGWRVHIDGQRADLLRVNYNLRGVQLEAGEHNVVFSYRPRSVIHGFMISVLVAAGLGFWCRRRPG